MIAFCLLLLAAADPGGWTVAKWGMSPDQILAAVPGAVRLERPEKLKDGPAPIALQEADRRILFICDPTLRAVAIQFTEPDPAQFLRVEAHLVSKYGRPWHRETSEIEQSGWTFATTLIQLRRVALRNIPFRSLWLTYRLRQPSAAY